MTFMIIFDEFAVSTIAERCIGRILAITKFVVSTLSNIKLDWSTSGHICIAAAITIWVVERNSTRTPIVYFSFLQICVIGEPTYFININIPVMKGMLGGLYLPSLYETDSGIGTVLY